MAITNSTLNRQSSFSSVGTESTTSSSSCSSHNSHHHGVVEQKQSSMKRRSTSSNHDDGNDDDDNISSRKLSFMISQLTTKEMELATHATNHDGGTSLLSFEKKDPDAKNHVVKQMAKRYLMSKKGNVTEALQKFKLTLQFRQEMDIKNLITCFDQQVDNNKKAKNASITTKLQRDDDDDNTIISNRLYKQLASKHMFVQGYDNDGRCTFIFRPCYVNPKKYNIEWSIKEAIYTIERAIACSSTRCSSSRDDQKINAIVDLKGFNPLFKHTPPPLDIGKQFMLTLRNHYAGCINKIFIIDAPSSFSLIYNMFSSFIGNETKSKIQFIKSTNTKDVDSLLQSYDENEIPSWLMFKKTNKKNKKEKKNKNKKQKCITTTTMNDTDDCIDIDIQKYLYEIPFNQPYYN